MIKLLTAAVLSSVLFSSCIKRQLLTEQEVIDVINKFDEGWKNKNLKEVDSVLAPPYIYFTQSGGLFSRAGVVKTAGSPEYKLDSVWRHAIDVKLYENTAIVSTEWEGKGIYRGVPFNEDQRCSIIVVKTNNKVEILSEHCTPIKTDHKFH
jgi:Domain of unknown function (DUF4440)